MSIGEWIKMLNEIGLVCDRYSDKVSSVMSKKDMIDMALDINGMSFIPSMASAGYPIDCDAVCSEYGKFINGRYRRDKDGYTSSMYCKHDGVVYVDTALTLFLSCNADVYVDSNGYVRIFVDGNSSVTIHADGSSHAIVEAWDGSSVSVSGNESSCIIHYNN